ncbi:hypothetical protein AB0G21_35090, partial [Streptomyces sp. NPDC023588]
MNDARSRLARRGFLLATGATALALTTACGTGATAPDAENPADGAPEPGGRPRPSRSKGRYASCSSTSS